MNLPDLPVPRGQPPLIFNPAPNVIDYAGDDDKDEPARPRDQQDIEECHSVHSLDRAVPARTSHDRRNRWRTLEAGFDPRNDD